MEVTEVLGRRRVCDVVERRARYAWLEERCTYSCEVVFDSVTLWTVSPGSSFHGDFSGKNTGVGCYLLLQEIFLIQGLNQCLLHCRRILTTEPSGKKRNRR